MADGLFMPDGNFVPFNAAELSTELATRQNAGVFFGELDGWLAGPGSGAAQARG